MTSGFKSFANVCSKCNNKYSNLSKHICYETKFQRIDREMKEHKEYLNNKHKEQ